MGCGKKKWSTYSLLRNPSRKQSMRRAKMWSAEQVRIGGWPEEADTPSKKSATLSGMTSDFFYYLRGLLK